MVRLCAYPPGIELWPPRDPSSLKTVADGCKESSAFERQFGEQIGQIGSLDVNCSLERRGLFDVSRYDESGCQVLRDVVCHAEVDTKQYVDIGLTVFGGSDHA